MRGIFPFPPPPPTKVYLIAAFPMNTENVCVFSSIKLFPLSQAVLVAVVGDNNFQINLWNNLRLQQTFHHYCSASNSIHLDVMLLFFA